MPRMDASKVEARDPRTNSALVAFEIFIVLDISLKLKGEVALVFL